MWTKYPNGMMPSTDPENPNALDKLAALVDLARKRHKERMGRIESEKKRQLNKQAEDYVRRHYSEQRIG